MHQQSTYHQAVLLSECIEQLNIQPDGYYLDATFGGGGHSKAILSKLGPKGRLMVFDQDEDARKNDPGDSRLLFIRENFRYAHRFVRMYGWKLDGVLADLGVSSWQFDTAERGFSTRFDAALDMRMDLRIKTDASAILNQYPEAELYRLFEDYGEVTNARSLARSIVEYRKQAAISTISGFKQLIGPQVYGNPNKYLAQVFQALRIEVNDEINALRDFLSGITPYLKPGGRLCIISFHSLEDRLVKNWIKNQSFSEHEEHPFLSTRRKRLLRNVHKKPVLPGNDELNQNPRARSAKLRVAERLTDE